MLIYYNEHSASAMHQR